MKVVNNKVIFEENDFPTKEVFKKLILKINEEYLEKGYNPTKDDIIDSFIDNVYQEEYAEYFPNLIELENADVCTEINRRLVSILNQYL